MRATMMIVAGLALSSCGAGEATVNDVIMGVENAADDSTATSLANAEGMISLDSPYSVDRTVDRLEAEIAIRKMILVAKVDHAANAEDAGLKLRPTMLLIFGTPAVGTRLMQASPTAGLDLPQRMLVYRADDGQVRVVYDDPAWVAERHSITGQDDAVTSAARTLAEISAAATARP